MFARVVPAATFLTANTLEGLFGAGCQGVVRRKRMERSPFPTLQAGAKGCLSQCLVSWLVDTGGKMETLPLVQWYFEF